jgi:hypothetical protein
VKNNIAKGITTRSVTTHTSPSRCGIGNSKAISKRKSAKDTKIFKASSVANPSSVEDKEKTTT